MFLNFFKNFLILSTLLLFVACGGKGSSSNNSTKATVKGTIQKGPFIKGSIVKVYKLNNGKKGEELDTTTTNDKGEYSIQTTWGGATLVELVQGKYLSEKTGEYVTINGKLSAVGNLALDKTTIVNINVFTSLVSKNIVKNLENGTTIEKALEDAQNSIETTFKVKLPENTSVEQLNILRNDNDPKHKVHAELFAISTAIASQTNPSEVIETLTKDFKDDGIINQEKAQEVFSQISTQAHTIDLEKAATVIEKKLGIKPALLTKTDGTGQTDTTAPEKDGDVKYTPNNPSASPVTVSITFNEAMQKKDGWKLSADKKTFSKDFTTTTDASKEKFKDLAGNKSAEIDIDKITIEDAIVVIPDTTAPEKDGDVKYTPNNPSASPVTVSITFNEEMSAKTGWTLSNGNKTLSKNFTATTNANTQSFKDLAGISSADISIDKIIIDSVKPTVSLTSPNPTTDVEVTSNIVVKFSEAIKNYAGNVILKQGATTIDATLNLTANSLTIKPKVSLEEGKTYTVSLNDKITDMIGNKLEAKDFTFTTKNAIAKPTKAEFTIKSISGDNKIDKAESALNIPVIINITSLDTKAKNTLLVNDNIFNITLKKGENTLNIPFDTLKDKTTLELKTVSKIGAHTEIATASKTYSIDTTAPVSEWTKVTGIDGFEFKKFDTEKVNSSTAKENCEQAPNNAMLITKDDINTNSYVNGFDDRTTIDNIVKDLKLDDDKTKEYWFKADEYNTKRLRFYNGKWNINTGGADTYYICKRAKTTPDNTAPEFKSSTPINEAKNVSLNTEISVTFNEDLGAFDINKITLTPEGDGGISGLIATISGAKLTITGATLTNAKKYTLSLQEGAVKDKSTNKNVAKTIKFTTVDVTPIDNDKPKVSSAKTVTGNKDLGTEAASPLADVETTDFLQIIFNEDVKEVTTDNVKLTLDSNNVNISIETVDKKTYTIKPSSLEAGKTYILTLKTDIKDISAQENTLAEDKKYYFTVKSAAPVATCSGDFNKEYKGKCYKIVTSPKITSEAEKYCQTQYKATIVKYADISSELMPFATALGINNDGVNYGIYTKVLKNGALNTWLQVDSPAKQFICQKGKSSGGSGDGSSGSSTSGVSDGDWTTIKGKQFRVSKDKTTIGEARNKGCPNSNEEFVKPKELGLENCGTFSCTNGNTVAKALKLNPNENYFVGRKASDGVGNGNPNEFARNYDNTRWKMSTSAADANVGYAICKKK